MENENENKNERLQKLLSLAEHIIERSGSDVNKDLEGYYDVLTTFLYIQDDPDYYKKLLTDNSFKVCDRQCIKSMLFLSTETDLTLTLMSRLEIVARYAIEDLHKTLKVYTDELFKL